MPLTTRLRAWMVLWAPVVGWATMIYWFSSMSSPPTVPGGLDDRHAHLAVYFVLGILLVRALAGGVWRGVTWRIVALAAALTTLYGVSDELHQRFVPQRTASLSDLAADAAGAAMAGVLLRACAIIAARRAS